MARDLSGDNLNIALQYRPIKVIAVSPPVNGMIHGNPRTICLEAERLKENNPPIMIESRKNVPLYSASTAIRRI
jgi:hypothetical protein